MCNICHLKTTDMEIVCISIFKDRRAQSKNNRGPSYKSLCEFSILRHFSIIQNCIYKYEYIVMIINTKYVYKTQKIQNTSKNGL